MKKCRLIWLLLLVTIGSARADMEPKRILKEVEKKLTEAVTFQADFLQEFYWKMTEETQLLKGTIYLKSDDHFYIETEDQIIVSDGRTLWMFNKMANRVLIDNLINSDETILPRQIFMKHTEEYNSTLKGEETVEDVPCYYLQLTALTEDTFVPVVNVWIQKNEWVPVKIEQIDINENRTIYIMKNIVTGQPVDEKMFTFSVSEGMEIIDMR